MSLSPLASQKQLSGPEPFPPSLSHGGCVQFSASAQLHGFPSSKRSDGFLKGAAPTTASLEWQPQLPHVAMTMPSESCSGKVSPMVYDSYLGEVVLEAMIQIRKGQLFEIQRSLPEDDIRKRMARLGVTAETLDSSYEHIPKPSCQHPARLHTGCIRCFDVNCHSGLKEAALPLLSSRNKI